MQDIGNGLQIKHRVVEVQRRRTCTTHEVCVCVCVEEGEGERDG